MAIAVKWNTTEVVARGGTFALRAQLSTAGTTKAWIDLFNATAGRRSGEDRNQGWGDVRVLGETVEVDGIRANVDDEALKTYVDEIVSIANLQAEKVYAEAEEQALKAAATQKGLDEIAAELATRFRSS
jgi:hypothetical protein